MLDIHAHILPGIDDGSTSMQMTRDMLREAKAAGVSIIVASPHLRSRKNDRNKIQQVFTEVQHEAKAFEIQMLLGFEVHYSMLKHQTMLSVADWCIQGTHSLLLEFPSSTCPTNWDVFVCDLIRNGYQPVIAHPERCINLQDSFAMVTELKRYGCELQVNAQSLQGMFSFRKRSKKAARMLLHIGIVDYIASDAHRPKDYRKFRRIYQRLGQRFPKKTGPDKVLHT